MHLGSLIKQRAEALGIGPTKLASLINTSKQNVYGIYKRKSVDSELLALICSALKYDFFRLYTGTDDFTKDEIIYENSSLHTVRKLNKELSQCRYKLKDMEEKNEMLKKINELLEKRNA